MRELKTIKELNQEAHTLAVGSGLVRHRDVIYIPVDYETRDMSAVPHAPPPIERTIWIPLSHSEIEQLAGEQFDTAFRGKTERDNFCYMLAQHAEQSDKDISTLLVRTKQGLRELNEQGELVDSPQEFRPNTLYPMLNEDQADKDKVFAVISGWLESDEEAHSLLRHLATSLAPGWSAVKYVLLLGDGRNGKSVMLKMIEGLFGRENVSSVTRQMMSEQNATVTELNGKLLNLIYDGRSEYVKDSGTEKSLVAGDPAPIRKLYDSTVTMVQSNALFIEGLNREPKTKDKSSALQKRLVRFHFPRVYPVNIKFQRDMLTEKTLGAFLALLIEHYVTFDEVAEALAPTVKAKELQLEHQYANQLGMQFLQQVVEKDGIDAVLGQPMPELVERFIAWRVSEFDTSWSEVSAAEQLQPLFETELKSKRTGKQVRKVRMVVALKEETTEFIESLKGEDTDDEIIEAVVADGDV